MKDICDHIESGEASSKTVHLLAELGQVLREKEKKLKAKIVHELCETSSKSYGNVSVPEQNKTKTVCETSSTSYGDLSVLPDQTNQYASSGQTYEYQHGSYDTSWSQSTPSKSTSYDTTWPQNTPSQSTSYHTSWPQSKASSYEQPTYTSTAAVYSSQSAISQSYGATWHTTTYDSSVAGGQTGASTGGNTTSTYTNYTQPQSSIPNPWNTGYSDSQQTMAQSHSAVASSQQHTIPMLPITQTPPRKPDVLESTLTPNQKNLLSEWQMISSTTAKKIDLDAAPQGDSATSTEMVSS